MNFDWIRGLPLGALLSLATVTVMPPPGASAANRPESTPQGWRTVEASHTNFNTRFITNIIQVTVPRNVFLEEYRTNWVERTLTNVVDVFVTNWSTRNLTNVINVSVTNWSTRTITNTVTFQEVRTNMIDQFLTNWTTLLLTNEITLTVTNFETVVVTKTNWIKQQVPQVVEVNLPAPAVAPSVAEAAPAAVGDTLVIDAVKTSRLLADGQIEVRFRVQLARDAAAPLQVQQWRVERDDGAALFFGQNQEFKRAVPAGRYRVEVKARRDAENPFLSARTTLDVTRDAVARR